MTTATRPDLASALARHAFFRDFTPAHLDLLATGAVSDHFAAGEFLGREGERADYFHLLLNGLVALETGRAADGPIVVQSIGPNEVLGWSWLVPPYRWAFDARAIEDVDTVAFDARRLRLLCEGNHELGYQILNRLVQVTTDRLAATRRQLVENTRVHL